MNPSHISIEQGIATSSHLPHFLRFYFDNLWTQSQIQP